MIDQIHKTTIGGLTYTVPTMPGLRGRKVLLRLLRVAGPLLAANKDSGRDLSDVVQSVLGNLDDSTFDWILGQLIQGAMVGDGDTMRPLSVQTVQDEVWADGEGYLHMVDFIVWALRVNFGGFIEGLKQRASALKNVSSVNSPAKKAG